MNPWFVGIIFLILFAIVLVAISLGHRFVETQSKKRVEAMLHAASGETEQKAETSILNDSAKEDPVKVLLAESQLPEKIAGVIQQAGLSWTVTHLVILMLIGGIIGATLGWVIQPLGFQVLSAVALAFALGGAPYFYLNHKRTKRMAEFEAQLPEALDFLARSMRAGHAFSISLEMLGSESPDPIGQEFRTLFNEQNLGAPIEVALGNFGKRVPLLDVRLFVSTVLLQRQTGGNLSEVLTRLGYIIRERFRLRGQVRAASAHGRLTSIILSVLPLFLVAGLLVIAPGYLQDLAKDPDGKWMIAGAIAGQILAYFIMRRIIDIKV
jgi:tight adherence protein B